MKVSKEINKRRRKIMRFLTKKIGVSKAANEKIENPSQIKKILICRPNARLGNLLLITPLVQEVQSHFPDAKIDLFVKGGLMPVILQNYQQIDSIIVLPKKPFSNLIGYLKVWLGIEKKNYDMVLNVDKDSSSGRLAVELSHAKYKFYGDPLTSNEETESDYRHIAKYPVYNFREYLNAIGIEVQPDAVPKIDLKLSDSEIEQGRNILNSKFENQKPTIALFTFATGDKCFSQFWWTDFYDLLKRKYERDFNILEILPVENVSQINFKATSYYSKDIREIGSVIANSAVFIGADSGIMHLAGSVQTPTIGLFSVSDLKKYEPYGNNSIGIDTNSIVSKNQYIILIDSILAKD